MRRMVRRGATGLGCIIMLATSVAGCDREDARTSVAPGPASVSQSAIPLSLDSWVVDPTEPGTNLPPVGRSLFDFLITKDVNGKKIYTIPFPFTALLAHIESRLHSKRTPPALKRLLIPVNRSLQRRAGNGEFFAYPRAVLAVDTEAEPAVDLSGMHLKDRLFIGYHEKTAVLEIISYNEAAGRFEFQIVSNYSAGGTPTVQYANRALCTACHQNQSPIFSRPMWDETNVNPKIAALLAHQRRPYYGFPIRQGAGTLQAFDDATDRANDISLAQLLWREGCEQAGNPKQAITCRAELFEWVLRYGSANVSVPDWHTAGHGQGEPPSFLAAWRARWPHGLAIPNPDISNRNPFRYVAVSEFPGLSEVQATALEGREPRSMFRGPFEPTLLREPLEVWTIPDTPQALERVLAAFAQFFTKADLNRLDRVRYGQPERLKHTLNTVANHTLMGRTDAFSNQPFRRAALLAALDRELGAQAIPRCCLDDRGMPPPVDEVVESHHPNGGHEREVPPAGGLKPFHEYCGACHHGTDGFPPNFLHGSPAEVKANFTQCADRIFVRLRMWDSPSSELLEAPMPPAMHLLHHRVSLDQWKSHPDLQVLRKETVAAIQQKRGATFNPEDLLRQDYDTLPACLAPRREPTVVSGTEAHHG